MNAKLCKKLRRAANARTVGLPAVTYQRHNYGPRERIELGDCTRLSYKMAKQAIKRNQSW